MPKPRPKLRVVYKPSGAALEYAPLRAESVAHEARNVPRGTRIATNKQRRFGGIPVAKIKLIEAPKLEMVSLMPDSDYEAEDFAVLDATRPNARRRSTCRPCIRADSRAHYHENKEAPKTERDVSGGYEWFPTDGALVEQELCRRMVDDIDAAELTEREWDFECDKAIAEAKREKGLVA